MDTLVLAMPDTDMLLLMPMVLTMERGLLMLSPRLMLMLSMVLAMAMVDTVLAMLDMPVLAMLDMPLPMPMVLTMARGLLMLSPRLMPTMVSMESKVTIPSTNRVAHQVQTEAQKQTFEIN